MIRFVVHGLILSVAVVATATDVTAASQAGAFDVSVKSGRLTVQADGARLGEVLKAIGEKAGVRFVLSGDLKSTVTESFVNLILDDALRRLLRGYSLVLVYEPLAGNPERVTLAGVWVTDSSARSTPRTAEPAVQAQPNRFLDARQPAPARTNQVRTALGYASSAERRRVIDGLVREQGEPAVVGILREAASRDSDSRVRRGAIQSLAVINSQEATDAARAALRDGDPSVRREAIRTLGRHGQLHGGNDAVQ